MNKKQGTALRTSALISAVYIAAGIAALFYCEWKGSFTATFNARDDFFYLAPVFFIIMTFAHARGLKSMPAADYVKKTLGYSEKERIVYLDCIRFLAIACIILTHACSMQKGQPAPLWKTNLLKSLASVTLVANPLYIMISGALTLSSSKNESVGHFYWTRFVKVVVPAVILYAIFMIILNLMDAHDPASVMDGIKQILAGANYIVPHFWFIYMLVALYIAAPFLKVMVRSMTDKEIHALFILILAEELLTTFLPMTEISLGITLDFGSFAGVFLMGYIITNRSNRIMDIFLMISGSLCGIYTAVIVLIEEQTDVQITMLYNCSPIAVLFACAIVVALRRNEARLRKLPHKITAFISVISVNGYLMLLLHWYVLYYITMLRFFVNPLRFGCIGGIAATLVLTASICCILSVITENTIVISAKYLLSLPADIFRSIRQKKQVHIDH